MFPTFSLICSLFMCIFEFTVTMVENDMTMILNMVESVQTTATFYIHAVLVNIIPQNHQTILWTICTEL